MRNIFHTTVLTAFSRSFNISAMNHYHLVFLVIASSIACLPIESAALSQNCNPIGIDRSQVSRKELGREFTLKPGEMVEDYLSFVDWALSTS